MDKQFMRILMLSVLLPAGAALGEALQKEHVSFPAADPALLSRLEELPVVAVKKPEPVAARAVTASRAAEDDRRKDGRREYRQADSIVR